MGWFGIGDDTEEEEDKGNPKRFDPQCFLMDFYKSFVRANQTQTYATFTKINVDPSEAVIQLMNKKDGFPLNDLTPAQLSGLVPKFRLYKLYGKTGRRKEFYFDDHTSLYKPKYADKYEELTINHSKKPVAVGFKNFSWDDLGQNPANQGLTFKASLTLACSSMQALFRKGENGLSCDELICPAERKETTENPSYKAKDNRFQAEIGWVLPPSFQNSPTIWGSKAQQQKIKDAISEANIALFLNLQSHELSINEDGTIEVAIDFMASLEAGLFSPASDLFYPGKDSKAIVKSHEDHILGIEDALDGLEDEKSAAAKRGLVADEFWSWDDPEMEAIYEAIETKEAEIQEAKDFIASMESSWTIEKWSSLLTRITERGRFFKIEFSGAELAAYQALNALYVNKTLSPHKVQRKRRALLKQFRLFSQDYMPEPRSAPYSATYLQSEIGDAARRPLKEPGFGLHPNTWGAALKGLAFDDRKEQMADAAENALELVESAQDPDNKVINYIYMGDLLESAFGIVRQNQIDDLEDQTQIFRYMVGSIKIFDFEYQKYMNVNVADIPICWEYFMQFFIEKVLKQDRKKWNIRSFVKDVISELLVGALGPNCYGKITPKAKTRVSTQVMTLPSRGGFDEPLAVGGKIYDNVGGLVRWSNPKFYYNYLFIYPLGGMNYKWNGDYKEDQEKNNILHLQIGADRGLLKTVEFKRQDIPGQKEANIKRTIDDGGAIGNMMFSNKYNADLTLFGNTLFTVGSTVYLDPRGLGMGGLNDAGSMAKKLGIGGYYAVTKVESVIEPGKFETSLTTVLQGLGTPETKEPDTINAPDQIDTCHSLGNCEETGFTAAEPPIDKTPPRYGAGRARHWKSMPD